MAAIDIDENIPRNSAMSDALIRTKTIFSKPTNPEYIKSNFIIFQVIPQKNPEKIRMTRKSFKPKIRRGNVLRQEMTNVLLRCVKSPSLDWTRLFSPHASWPISAFVPSLNDSDWSDNLQLTRSFRSSKKYFKSLNQQKQHQSRWRF